MGKAISNNNNINNNIISYSTLSAYQLIISATQMYFLVHVHIIFQYSPIFKLYHILKNYQQSIVKKTIVLKIPNFVYLQRMIVL